MRPIAHTITYDHALKLVSDAAVPVARTERVSLADADGRVAARDITAVMDVPPFDRAAMDGYAVIAANTAGASKAHPAVLTCVDRVFTGQVPGRRVNTGECIEIATGAPMPAGADAVVMVEETGLDGDRISIRTSVAPRQHVGRRGADISAGQVVISAGDLLSPARVGAVAAAGVVELEVYARPTVALLSTGNEIVEPGTALAPG